jgi:hypothetical protein
MKKLLAIALHASIATADDNHQRELSELVPKWDHPEHFRFSTSMGFRGIRGLGLSGVRITGKDEVIGRPRAAEEQF